MKNNFTKIISLLLIVGMNWSGISLICGTDAYFNDVEISEGNSMTAGTLDFRLTSQNVSGFVGMENDGEIFHTSVTIPESGSMPMQYFAYSDSASLACSEFRVRVKQNETEIFYGPLPNFLSDKTTVFGTWKFEFDLPVGASITQGDLCQADIIFSAWREEIENPEESGFFDTETLSLNLKAKTIVLNEVLANPDNSHPYPENREFIELKNNGNAPVDVAGWKVSEMTGGGAENKYTITTAGGSYTASPYGGSTIIPAGGWLVLFLSNTTALNNDGDTIRLYDSSDNKLDEYSYEAAKYGMSDARYLDGIGGWVDPIPTPGGTNEIEENLITAGLDGSDGGSIFDDISGFTPVSPPWAEAEASDEDADESDDVMKGDTGTDDTGDTVDTGSDGTSGSTAFQDYGTSDGDDTGDTTDDADDDDDIEYTDSDGTSGSTAFQDYGTSDDITDDDTTDTDDGDSDTTDDTVDDTDTTDDDTNDSDDSDDTDTDTDDADDDTDDGDDTTSDIDAGDGDDDDTGGGGEDKTGEETKPEADGEDATGSTPDDGASGDGDEDNDESDEAAETSEPSL